MVLASDYDTDSYLSTGAQAGGGQGCFWTNTVSPFIQHTVKPFVQRQKLSVAPQNLQPKIILYSHDTFGLGNIRRTLLLAENLIKEYPRASILIITGSPVIHAFRLPEGIDYIKLPSLDRVNAERYEPLLLADCATEIRSTRAAILEKAILGFAPDLLIVDKRAAGIDGELLDTLELLKAKNCSTKIVLGLRDILDAPARTAKTLRDNGSFETIEKYYDEVWIYGASEIFDAVREYEFPASIAKKTRYCGYLKRRLMNNTKGNGALRILATTGGGGDGSRMIETFLQSLPLLSKEIAVRATVIFGPQMPAAKREEFQTRYANADTQFLDFEPDLTKHYTEADVVVSMAGYNTVCELLSLNKRAVLVPRSEPVQEQLIRARLLSGNGFFEYIEPKELDAAMMSRKIMHSMKTICVGKHFLDLDGLPRINERVRDLLTEKEVSYV
jgi:predicted glycosyltransferase